MIVDPERDYGKFGRLTGVGLHPSREDEAAGAEGLSSKCSLHQPDMDSPVLLSTLRDTSRSPILGRLLHQPLLLHPAKVLAQISCTVCAKPTSG